jgi:hypothetical protein
MHDRINTINELANRRQYFRIKDKASVEIAVLEQHHSAAEYFELNPEFGLISEFQLLDVESKHLLHAMTDKDKNLGQLLKVLNKKLDSLSRVLALSKQPVDKSHIQDIDLSEGGLSLKSPDFLKDDQLVAIKLILLPSYSGLLLTGSVLSCQGEKAPYDLHLGFSDISEAHQQLIARHIMRKQTQNRQPDDQ